MSSPQNHNLDRHFKPEFLVRYLPPALVTLPLLMVQCIMPPVRRGQPPNQVQLFDPNASRLDIANQLLSDSPYYLDASEIAIALGYRQRLAVKDYIYEFERGGIAATIVSLLAEDTWNTDWYVFEDPDPDITTKFEAEFQALDERLNLFSECAHADVLSRLGQHGTILLGLEGDLDKEPKPRKGQANLFYVAAHTQTTLKIGKLIEDGSSPNYKQPEYYVLNNKQKVHPKRVIHVVDRKFMSPLYHVPALKQVWNHLEDLRRVVGGGALAAWRRADPGIHIPLSPEAQLSPSDEAALEKSFIEWREKKRTVMITEGVEKVDLLSSPVHVFQGNADAIMSQIAATTRYPKKHLEGTQSGKLAADQDSRNYWTSVQKRRNSFAVRIVRAIVDRLMFYGVLPAIDQYFVEGTSDNDATPAEIADINYKRSQTNTNQINSGDTIYITSAEMREAEGYEPLEEATGEDDGLDNDDDDGDARDEPDDDGDSVSVSSVNRARATPTISRSLAKSEYASIQQTAEDFAPSISSALDTMWTEITNQLYAKESALVLAYSDRIDFERLEQIVDEASKEAEAACVENLQLAYLSCMESAGNKASKFATPHYKQQANQLLAGNAESSGVEPRGLLFQLLFNLTNPKAVAWAAFKSSTLVKEIGKESRLALRKLMGEAFTLGIAPRSLAKFIVPNVGLRTDQLEAISNLKAQLLNAKPGDLITRFNPTPGSKRKLAGFRVKVPAGGPSSTWVDMQVKKYARLQHNYRGRMIGRTETLRAANEGQRQMWGQAVDAGLLPKDVQRVWIATQDERLRDEHAAMAGQKVGLNVKFERPDNGAKIDPGEEVQCRCGQRLEVGK